MKLCKMDGYFIFVNLVFTLFITHVTAGNLNKIWARTCQELTEYTVNGTSACCTAYISTTERFDPFNSALQRPLITDVNSVYSFNVVIL